MDPATATLLKEDRLHKFAAGLGLSSISDPSGELVRVLGRWGLPLLVVYAAVRSLIVGFLRPLWFDELLMRTVCRQGSLAGIWKALSAGLDGQPPLFYEIERAAAWLVPNEQIGYRLPSVLGLLASLVLLYLFVKRWSGVIPALACSLLLLLTPLFAQYNAEARPYCLVVACIALAMVCYQRVPAIPWTAGLFLSLLLACSLHYYAVLSLAPFFVAELTFAWISRQVRFSVWLALIVAPAPIAIAWPLLARLKLSYAQHFVFQSAALNSVSKAYGSYFRVESPWGTALAGIAVLAMLASCVPDSQRSNETKESRAALISDRVLVLALILVPVLGYLAAKVAHAPFVDRYFLPCVLGLGATFGYWLGRTKLKAAMVCALFVLLAVGAQELGVWRSHLRLFSTPAQQINLIAQLPTLVHHRDLPIVISDVGAYVEFWSYAPAALRSNVYGLSDPANAALYAAGDTPDRLALTLRSYEPISVEDFATFAGAHSSFLLLSNGSQFDWWPARLLHDGDRLQLLALRGQYAIYLVELVKATSGE